MIRSYIPDVGLSSDIMVGFPTETEEDFADTMNVVRKVGYNNLYTFIYSRRSGTPADKMEQVDLATKNGALKNLSRCSLKSAVLSQKNVSEKPTAFCATVTTEKSQAENRRAKRRYISLSRKALWENS